jgi:RHS repeat-associated protein
VYYFGVFMGPYGTRNANGNITSQTIGDSSNCGTVYSVPRYYSYDNASRVVYSGPTAQGGSANNLSYDPSGNVTQIYSNIGPRTYSQTTDNAGEALAQTPIGTGNSSTFTYDTIGDQVTNASAGLTATSSFNQIGQMTSFAKSGTTTTYLANGDGLETSNKVGSGTQNQLVWNTANTSLPLLMSDGNDYFIYGPGTTPVEQYNITTSPPSSNPTFLNYADDGISSYMITNTAGAYTNGSSFDMFGTPCCTFASSGTVFGFAGQYSDGYGSGLVNMRARWYEPGTGTFTGVDPALSSTNQPYEYAGDNPTNRSDPSGKATVGICAGVSGQFPIFGLLGINASVGDCLTRTVDSSGEDDIGLVGTAGVGGGLGIGASIGLYYQISNATNLQELSRLFFYTTSGVDAVLGANATVFWSPDRKIYGVDLGVSFGGGADVAVGTSWTWVDQFYGSWSANIARGVWDAFNPGLALGLLLRQARVVARSGSQNCGVS